MLLQLELFLKQHFWNNKILKSHIMDFPLNMYHLFQRRCKYIGRLCVCVEWNQCLFLRLRTGLFFLLTTINPHLAIAADLEIYPNHGLLTIWSWHLFKWTYLVCPGTSSLPVMWSVRCPLRVLESSLTWYELVTYLFLCADSLQMCCASPLITIL